MAGPTNRNVISVDDAKSRLLAFGQQEDSLTNALTRPVLRIGATLLAGAYLGHRLRRPRKADAAISIGKVFSRAAMAATPLLTEQVIRNILGRLHKPKGDDAPPNPHPPQQ